MSPKIHQFNFENAKCAVIINFVQAIAGSLWWIGLSQLGNPISTKKRNFDNHDDVNKGRDKNGIEIHD